MRNLNNNSGSLFSGFTFFALVLLALVALSQGAAPVLVVSVFFGLIVVVGLWKNKQETGKIGGHYPSLMLALPLLCTAAIVAVVQPKLVFVLGPLAVGVFLVLLWRQYRSDTRKYWQNVQRWHELGFTGRPPAAFEPGWEERALEARNEVKR